MNTEAVWSLEAEVSVLGAPLVSQDAIDEVRAVLRPEDFFRDSHRKLFGAYCALRDQGEVVDFVTLKSRLERTGDLEAVGGVDYLVMIHDAIPTAANALYHARIVQDKARLRRLIEACQSTVQDVLEGAESNAAFEAVERRVLEASGASHGGAKYRELRDLLWPAMALIEREAKAKGGITGIPSGLPSLDHMTAGMQPGDLTILAARPSMGKTALACGVGTYAANHESIVAVVSLEMAADQLVKRMLAGKAGVDLMRIRRGELDERDYADLNDAATWLHDLPLWVSDQTSGSMAELRISARRLKRQGLGLLIVDYLQLLEGTGENRTQQVSTISRGLKQLARELDIHVLALSQLNRAVENRTPPRPQLSDLRDSGSLEQDADNVLMLWRPEYYFTDTTPTDVWAKWQGKGELIVAKQRNGPTGKILLHWEKETTRFTEAERQVQAA